MTDPRDLEALFLANLPAVERIVGILARRYGLSREDAEDFGSQVKLRLVENGYAVLAKFRGESSMTTYLSVVITMLMRELRVQRLGRWRPSAAAQRLGPVAVRLESLVYRSGHTLGEATQMVRTSGETALSEAEIAKLFSALPMRAPLRAVEAGPEALSSAPAETTSNADAGVLREAEDELRRTTASALMRALEALPPEDRLMVRMHYWEGMSVADIARALATPQKPLYRRLDRAVADLKRRLEAAGISSAHARSLLSEVGT